MPMKDHGKGISYIQISRERRKQSEDVDVNRRRRNASGHIHYVILTTAQGEPSSKAPREKQ